jgi:hypothetical protein
LAEPYSGRGRFTFDVWEKVTIVEFNTQQSTCVNFDDVIPGSFLRTMIELVSPLDSIRFQAFKPSRTTYGVRSPATLLTVSDRRWTVVSNDEYERVSVLEAAFAETLLVELTEILRRGQIRIDFVADGTAQTFVVEFDTLLDELYHLAIPHILRGIDGGVTTSRSDRPVPSRTIEMKPIIFRNAVPRTLAEGRRPIGAAQWPASFGAHGRELAPAAALLSTDRELVLISEKRVGIRVRGREKYGYVATYFPSARLTGFGLRRTERLSILDLDLHAMHSSETVEVRFPPQWEQEVMQVLDFALLP